MTSCLLVFTSTPLRGQESKHITVGSKAFAESRILAEMLAILAEDQGLRVERRSGLGGTLICWNALIAGEIDAYPEYGGTAWAVILKEKGRPRGELETFVRVRARCLREHAVRWLAPFGFDNGYAIAMRPERARELGISKLSDLERHAASLNAGVSLEFLKREDGWPGLVKAYGIGKLEVRGLEHGLSYPALMAGEIDLLDAYATDGKLERYKLTVLEDDRRFFPPYHAAPAVREATLRKYPKLETSWLRLAYRIDDATMRSLNYAVEVDKRDFAAVAREYLQSQGLLASGAKRGSQSQDLRAQGFVALLVSRPTLGRVAEHIGLTLAAVLLACLIAIPLGIACSRRRRLATFVLGFAGIVQTIPSLALLAFLIPIPVFGLGVRSAIFALFLYALLPIVRNTFTGIRGVRPELVDAARGLGLTDRQLLQHVELPLASRTILAGIRTATVISIGVATLAAFIGAGGLGEPILTGLQLADPALILSGALPAAALALGADFVLGRFERRLSAH